MLIKTTIHEALQSLYSTKQRSVLALIGIIIGIGSVIAMISIGQIVQSEALKQFKELGTDILTIQKGAVDPKAEGGAASRSAGVLKLKDIQEIPMNCPFIANIAPFVAASGASGYGGKLFENVAIFGVTQSFADLNKLKAMEGRLLSDVDEMSQFCVIGSQVYKKMKEWGAGKVVGEEIKIGGRLVYRHWGAQ